MSRSRRKTPIFGHTTAASDHPWKRRVARRLRHRVKQHLEQFLECDRFPGRPWDLDSCWSSEKDGKNYCPEIDPRWMRK